MKTDLQKHNIARSHDLDVKVCNLIRALEHLGLHADSESVAMDMLEESGLEAMIEFLQADMPGFPVQDIYDSRQNHYSLESSRRHDGLTRILKYEHSGELRTIKKKWHRDTVPKPVLRLEKAPLPGTHKTGVFR